MGQNNVQTGGMVLSKGSPPAQERQTQYFQPYAPVLHDLFLKWGLSRPASCLFPKNGRMIRYTLCLGG